MNAPVSTPNLLHRGSVDLCSLVISDPTTSSRLVAFLHQHRQDVPIPDMPGRDFHPAAYLPQINRRSMARARFSPLPRHPSGRAPLDVNSTRLALLNPRTVASWPNYCKQRASSLKACQRTPWGVPEGVAVPANHHALTAMNRARSAEPAYQVCPRTRAPLLLTRAMNGGPCFDARRRRSAPSVANPYSLREPC